MKAVASIAGAVAVLTLLSGAGIAAIEECTSINNDLDRLACYDKASGRTPSVDAMPGDGSAWNVRTETSEMTDEANVYMTVQSKEPAICNWNDSKRAILYVRCRENTTSLVFNTGCHMTSIRYDDYGDVMIRLDDDAARTISMTESTTNRALGLWRGGQSIPVIKSMFGKTQMIARMTPYGDNAMTLNFDISGLEEAIEPLREACHW